MGRGLAGGVQNFNPVGLLFLFQGIIPALSLQSVNVLSSTLQRQERRASVHKRIDGKHGSAFSAQLTPIVDELLPGHCFIYV